MDSSYKVVNTIMVIISFIETRLVHSKTSVELAKNATAPLLVISPSHGNVNYNWEQKTCLMGEWQTIKVPPWTCLLYVTSANQYRCTVGTSSILFDVKGCLLNVYLYVPTHNGSHTCNSCNTGLSTLPGMCTQCLKAQRLYIRKCTSACVTATLPAL